MLSDAELDHLAGILSLRESQRINLYCTPKVLSWTFQQNPILGSLLHTEKFRWVPVGDRIGAPIAGTDSGSTQLHYEAIYLERKAPSFLKADTYDTLGGTVAYKIMDRLGRSVIYAPAVAKIDERFLTFASECDCLLFDGSFWAEDEMGLAGVGSRTAADMGHLRIDGPGGSLSILRDFAGRKIYTHINNTNPILDDDSPERRAAETAGWEVAQDGMDFMV